MIDYRDKFRIIEDYSSGDYIFEAYGHTLGELFENCALACFYAMTEPGTVEQRISMNVEATGDGPVELLFSFISELIFLKDTEKMFFSGFKADIAPDQKTLKAVVAGEKIDYNKHVIKTDVKAITYHGLDIAGHEGGYRARVMIDL